MRESAQELAAEFDLIRFDEIGLDETGRAHNSLQSELVQGIWPASLPACSS